jgi:hypothetical protein
MSECHPEAGFSKEDHYRLAKNQVNAEFDQKLAKKSMFTSKSSIEDDRQKALSNVESQFWGGRGGGMVE